ncbi:hypothetical protein FB45DRAFT_981791 [Roridomyces roridus]|uniref:ubiquitinyl hydrolase 1 n=1 Tax=Roridomyces roridus TaxID=1738132 RepID=A0AAD7B839_9AGAR|nr:hypothetical protein FB45DRAFT_981791 [Roridomyces roridus]
MSFLLPWNWTHTTDRDREDYNDDDSESIEKRPVRTRRQQQVSSAEGKPQKSGMGGTDDALFPGLVNMSGTHCFMNSTLQALASLSSLPPYLSAIHTRAEALDVPTPVVSALLDLLTQLDTPDPSGRALRAIALVEALCTPDAASTPSVADGPNTSAKAAALLATHEHQDAQEFFQLLTECVREERARVVAEGAYGRPLGLELALEDSREEEEEEMGSSPFDGLTATRRACVRCGYTAAIRHFAFDSLQLPLESAGGMGGGWGGTPLTALLRAYTTLEILQDCPCRRCELRVTARRLADEIVTLEAPAPRVNGMIVDLDDGDVEEAALVVEDAPPPKKKGKSKSKSKAKAKSHDPEGEGPTPSRVRRIKVVKRMHERVMRALEAGRIEEEELEGWDLGEGGDALKGVKIERVSGGVCTRQSMLGRPPPILALHINRSIHTGMRMVKNGAHVAFSEMLDVGPFTTGGIMSLDPTMDLNGAPGGQGQGQEECVYRLAAAVCHYGGHSFGHYVCYRRAPVPPSSSSGAYVPEPPRRVGSAGTGTGWLRISDSHVERCGLEQVLGEGRSVFMLYYERVPETSTSLGEGEGKGKETVTPGIFEGLAGPVRPRVVRSEEEAAEEPVEEEGTEGEGPLPTPPPTPKGVEAPVLREVREEGEGDGQEEQRQEEEVKLPVPTRSGGKKKRKKHN